MKRWTAIPAGVVTMALLAGGPALAQQPQPKAEATLRQAPKC